MKNSPTLKNGLRMLVLAGALTPFATLGGTSSVAAYEEGGFYDNLRHIQTQKDMPDRMQGAQGPVRTDFAEPTSSWKADEGSFYDNLKLIQESPKPM